MGSLNNVNSGDLANSSCVQQIIDVLKGTAGAAGNIPISLTAISDSANFALDVKNLDPTNERTFRAQNSSGQSVLQVDITGPQADPTGGGLAPIVNTNGTQTLTNKTVSLFSAANNTLKVSQCRVSHSSSATLVSGNGLTLSFDSIVYDNDSLHSTSVTPTRITASRTGLWRVGANVRFDGNSSGIIEARLVQNGVTIWAREQVTNGAGGVMLNISTELELVATDYMEVIVLQNSGGNIGTVAAASYSPHFWASFAGSA